MTTNDRTSIPTERQAFLRGLRRGLSLAITRDTRSVRRRQRELMEAPSYGLQLLEASAASYETDSSPDRDRPSASVR